MSVFNPHRIFIYEKIKDTQIVKKILSQFLSAKIEYISNQSPTTIRKCEPAFATIGTKNKNAGIVDIAKNLLLIGTANRAQFVEKFRNKLDCLCPEFYCAKKGTLLKINTSLSTVNLKIGDTILIFK